MLESWSLMQLSYNLYTNNYRVPYTPSFIRVLLLRDRNTSEPGSDARKIFEKRTRGYYPGFLGPERSQFEENILYLETDGLGVVTCDRVKERFCQKDTGVPSADLRQLIELILTKKIANSSIEDYDA